MEQSDPFIYKILATDISDRAISKALAGRYSELEVQRGLTIVQLAKYFNKDNDGLWSISEAIAKNIQFKKMNLQLEHYPFNGFHFIFCRNVLIYQSIENKMSILRKLEASLAPGGFLILGVGESLIGLDQDFETIIMNNAVIYRKRSNSAYKIA